MNTTNSKLGSLSVLLSDWSPRFFIFLILSVYFPIIFLVCLGSPCLLFVRWCYTLALRHKQVRVWIIKYSVICVYMKCSERTNKCSTERSDTQSSAIYTRRLKHNLCCAADDLYILGAHFLLACTIPYNSR